MQPWQIKALELEQTALKHLDEIIARHELYISVVMMYLLIASGLALIALLCSGRRKSSSIRPVIFIQLSELPPHRRTYLSHYTTYYYFW